jgi:hypothetical protein
VLHGLKVYAAAALSMFLAACADSSAELHLPAPDQAAFELQVYPVLLRDCGFPECHGSQQRFFRVYGPGRVRYPSPTPTPIFAPATAAEISASYHRARSMLANEDGVDHAPLLRKPLYAEHGGADDWGENVYRSASDPNYVILANWAHSVPRGAAAPTVSGP